MRQCVACAWWDKYDDGPMEKPLGECKRYALGPKWDSPSDDSEAYRPCWPQTNPDDGCGDFKSKDAEGVAV